MRLRDKSSVDHLFPRYAQLNTGQAECRNILHGVGNRGDARYTNMYIQKELWIGRSIRHIILRNILCAFQSRVHRNKFLKFFYSKLWMGDIEFKILNSKSVEKQA